MGTKIGVLVLGILTTPIIVRFLGSGGYGDYALVMSVFSVLSVFTTSGIFNGIRKYIAEDRSIAHWNDHVFAFYFKLSILITGGFASLLAVFSQTDIVENMFSVEFQTYFIILAAYLFLNQFYSVGRGALMGFGLEHRSEPLQIMKKLTYAVTAVVLLQFGLGVEGVLIGQVTAALIVGAITLWLIREQISFSILFKRSQSVPRYELLSFNAYSILLAFLTISLYHVDILILRPVAGDVETGYYKAALVVAEFLWMAPMAIQYTLVHSTSEMWSKGQHETVTEIASQSTRLNLSLMVIMIIGLAALADVFVPIYFGSEFYPAVGPLLVLLPGVLGFALARPIFAIGQGKGELRSLVLATSGAAVLNLCLNLLLIPRYGMIGAALATSIGYGSMVLLHTWIARRIGFDPISDLRAIRIIAAGLLTAPIVFGLARILTPIPSLIVVPSIGFLLYFVLSIQLGVINTDEIELVRQKAPRKFDPLFKWILTLKR
ncbi:polysaccharide biosynthesis C-terminal domain-containing protein [Natronosalvus caseinilyticus]|uniref:oligosaccharide flippase family protein n=1 Tax=Natronosalvus caseinilyticus TaxID=2953747 RepID=UPI0028ABC2F5|nr:polysaccharide biosynthesis C-terminal domain-containing protein [Natronosalvus caseinilyticus]